MTPYLAIGAAYLLGAIPFSFWIVRSRTGRDLRLVGSGNPGATNALRTAGPALALAGLALDVAKGYVPVWLARWIPLDEAIVAGVAVAAVLGHVTSPFLTFQGGKGVATAVGALGALHPLAVLGAVGVFLVVVLATRYVSMGSIAAVLSVPVFWILSDRWRGYEPDQAGLTAAVAIALLVVVRHRSNLARLLAGREARLGRGGAA